MFWRCSFKSNLHPPSITVVLFSTLNYKIEHQAYKSSIENEQIWSFNWMALFVKFVIE